MSQAIEKAIRSFADDLSVLTRQLAIEALGGTLNTDWQRVAAEQLNGADRGWEEPGPGTAKAKSTKSGKKRDPKLLAALVEDLHRHITKNVGDGIETIAKDMKRSTTELELPIAKLLATSRIYKTGAKRATRYFPLAVKRGKRGK